MLLTDTAITVAQHTTQIGDGKPVGCFYQKDDLKPFGRMDVFTERVTQAIRMDTNFF